MRRFLALTAVSLLTWQSPLKAEETVADEAPVDGSLSDAIEDSERPHPRDQYNQWHCRARPRFGWRTFTGSSNYFLAGSGEGQEAHWQAYRRALRRCERFTVGFRRCYSDFQSDCWVQRYVF